MKNFINTIWKSLESKGRYTTLVSLFLATPVNTHAVIVYFSTEDWFTEQRIIVLCVFNALAWFWAIMPSKLSVKASNFEVTVED